MIALRSARLALAPLCAGAMLAVWFAVQADTAEDPAAAVERLADECRRPGVQEITAAEVLERQARGEALVLVDVRRAAEQAVSMLPDAVREEDFRSQAAPVSGMVVAYCTVGCRSGDFAREMAARGLRVLNLRGGILAWVLAGGKVYDAAGETRRIHVYGRRWNHPAAGYQAVW